MCLSNGNLTTLSVEKIPGVLRLTIKLPVKRMASLGTREYIDFQEKLDC